MQPLFALCVRKLEPRIGTEGSHWDNSRLVDMGLGDWEFLELSFSLGPIRNDSGSSL